MLGLGLTVLGLGLALKFQTARLESCKAEYQSFVSQTKALGDIANKKAREQEKADKLKKEKADESIRKLRSDNAGLVKRLRDARSSSGKLPPAPTASRRPDLACFDRETFERAYGELVAEVRGLADEGTESALSLDTAKRWASQ